MALLIMALACSCLTTGMEDSCMCNTQSLVASDRKLTEMLRAVGNGGYAGGINWKDMVGLSIRPCNY